MSCEVTSSSNNWFKFGNDASPEKKQKKQLKHLKTLNSIDNDDMNSENQSKADINAESEQ